MDMVFTGYTLAAVFNYLIILYNMFTGNIALK